MSVGETVREWGSTREERSRPLPCDEVLPDANASYHRAVSVEALPAVVFRWLCQLRIAPYSYDWIDNLGRRSPATLTPGLEALERGQPVMQIFDLVHFETDRSMTLRLRRAGLFPMIAVTYETRADGPGRCRLLARLVVRFRPGLWNRVVRVLLPAGDWIMMRRQLLNLKRLAETK